MRSFLLGLLASTAAAQSIYTDSKTGIKFLEQDLSSQAGPNGFRFGVALPTTTQTQYQNEYIGHITVGLDSGAGWGGVSHGPGMTSALLLIVWPNAGEIMTSFRFASGYAQPAMYSGNATLVPIAQVVNSTTLELIYRCINCWTWEQDGGASGSAIPPTDTTGPVVLGWAAHTKSPATPADPDSPIEQHPYYGQNVLAPAANARNSAYSAWIGLTGGARGSNGNSTSTPPSNPDPDPTPKPTPTPTPTPAACTSPNAPTDVYDYIIAGAGAGGIPIASRLSEKGKKVLLIEKGPPSVGSFGGKLGPGWLNGTGLTRFDVPGLCNQIWVDSAGIACPDIPTMAGCVLGGGTAVNAGLWWKGNPADFDTFPEGWKSSSMHSAIERVFKKIPGTYVPSVDGKTYLRQGFQAVSTALAAAGWKSVDANAHPGQKHKVYTQTPYMFSHGERGGPMATYLTEAKARANFKLIMNTSVRRVLRDGGHATGVEVEAFNANGLCGTVKLAPKGRVILSAGAFGSPKILLRSGIGPTDQLNIVKSSADGPTMIDSAQWINLPVGSNLDDHTNTDMVIRTNSVFYDFYAAWTNPIPADRDLYLKSRSGILAQSAPNIGPIFFDIVKPCSDGIARQLQWTARVEGATGFAANTSMVLSQYLGRGKTSRGKISINKDLTMSITTSPHATTKGDNEAIVLGIKHVISALRASSNITILRPALNSTTGTEDFVAGLGTSPSARTANHWVGTARMGLDSGLKNNGTSVVNTNTVVYGTDNIHVVDASIFPGIVSNNPSALIVSVAERAYDHISKLD